MLSLTLPSDFGTVYRPDEITELDRDRPGARSAGPRRRRTAGKRRRRARLFPCRRHLAGRRRRLSLGATKNGALSAEAIVVFDDRIADELVYRTKRSGHVTSKMRFQSAQMTAYLTDGLWLRLASACQPADGRAGGGARSSVVRRALVRSGST